MPSGAAGWLRLSKPQKMRIRLDIRSHDCALMIGEQGHHRLAVRWTVRVHQPVEALDQSDRPGAGDYQKPGRGQRRVAEAVGGARGNEYEGPGRTVGAGAVEGEFD